MFRKCFRTTDPFNRLNQRNVSNTPKNEYNCAGYALGTFSWYCPHDDDGEDEWDWGWDGWVHNEEEAMLKTMHAVKVMVRDFRGTLRMIETVGELDVNNERLVAFRISSDGDFHYIKKAANGHWYHKMGASRTIHEMSEFEVFHSEWCDRYDGPLVLLAIKK